MGQLFKFGFMFALLFFSLQSYGLGLSRSPKSLLIRWNDHRPDSRLEIAQALDAEKYVFNLNLCQGNENAKFDQAYVLDQDYAMLLDSKPFHATSGFRRICRDDRCFYFHQVSFNTSESCKSGHISDETVKQITMSVQISNGSGMYPPTYENGFQMQWNLSDQSVLINEIQFDGNDNFVVPKGRAEILSWYEP